MTIKAKKQNKKNQTNQKSKHLKPSLERRPDIIYGCTWMGAESTLGVPAWAPGSGSMSEVSHSETSLDK